MARYEYLHERNLTKGFDEVLYYLNDITESWISNFILIGIFVILALNIYGTRKDPYESFAIAGFITFLISVLFWIAGFVSGVTVTITVAVALIGFVALGITKRK